MNHPFIEEACKERLLNEYEKYKCLYIAYDFDNTIFDYHNGGGDYTEVINLLRRASEAGFKLILFTAETDVIKLQWKINYVRDLGIRTDYINYFPVIPTSIKPYYNILLDDRAGLESSYNNLKAVLDYVDIKSCKTRKE